MLSGDFFSCRVRTSIVDILNSPLVTKKVPDTLRERTTCEEGIVDDLNRHAGGGKVNLQVEEIPKHFDKIWTQGNRLAFQFAHIWGRDLSDENDRRERQRLQEPHYIVIYRKRSASAYQLSNSAKSSIGTSHPRSRSLPLEIDIR